MKKKILLLVAIFVILNSSLLIHNCQCQWVQMSNGMGSNEDVLSLATNGTYIFAGTDYVYRSSNNGTNWIQTSLTTPFISALLTLNNNIYAGANAVFRSTNNGTNWIQTSLYNQGIMSFAAIGNFIFAGTAFSGVYLSTNNGNNWTQKGLSNNIWVYTLAVSGNNIYAGTGDSGVYRSTNNGNTWTLIFSNNQEVTCLAVSGNHIYAGTYFGGLYRSTNNGNNWTQTTMLNTVNSIAISGNYIFIGTCCGSNNNGINLSTNNGITWSQINQGFSFIPTVRAFLIINNYIFAGIDDHSVWRRSLSEIIGIKNVPSEIPSSYKLEQNYPNPFNPSTSIKFALPKNEFVNLKIFDMLGRKVSTLVNEKLSAGTYQVEWNASEFNSGVYFYRIGTEDFTETKSMILMK